MLKVVKAMSENQQANKFALSGDAMQAAGLAAPEGRLVYGDYWESAPRVLARALTDGTRTMPEAVVCGNDRMAISLCDALQERGIRTCVHLIDGLPGEDADAMTETARQVGALHPQAVKLSLLHILEGTRYAQAYRRGEIVPMTQEEYIRTVCTQLCYLPPETVIERLTGDGEKSRLLAPDWSRDKLSTLGGIDRYLAEHDLMQGCRM